MSVTAILIGLAIDVVVITTLVYAVYRPRHSKSDLALSYVVLNLGVFGAVALLVEVPSGLALGMGLFGILSIIRLRSSAISQTEVAYYFVALVLGLVNSLGASRLEVSLTINVLLVLALTALDRGAKALAATTETRRIVLDVVHPDAASLRRDLEFRLGGPIVSATVEEVDYLREVTVVQVQLEKVPFETTEQSDPIGSLAASTPGTSPRPIAPPVNAGSATDPFGYGPATTSAGREPSRAGVR